MCFLDKEGEVGCTVAQRAVRSKNMQKSILFYLSPLPITSLAGRREENARGKDA